MRKLFSVFCLFLIMSAFSTVSAKDLYNGGIFVIATFEYESSILGDNVYDIHMPRDQFDDDFNGIDTILILLMVDEQGYKKDYSKDNRSKLHQRDLKPIIAILDSERKYYDAELDLSSEEEGSKFRIIFAGRHLLNTNLFIDHNVTKASVVENDPRAVFHVVGDMSYYGYYGDFVIK